MSKETTGRAATRKPSISQWRMQNFAQESVDSSDEEFFDARVLNKQCIASWRHKTSEILYFQRRESAGATQRTVVLVLLRGGHYDDWTPNLSNGEEGFSLTTAH
ncbi:hypothetical protein AAFF_G00195930 [Aldrovandia affinis]|uniref:Uncharacterized protein n=1 Tax=Aldrovandia affinis TaxID=143900 RepID=A0AAD7W6D8_9TELE|nr:hypothetical protein AAFF_G00195930 [Aldrovandia affinis]